MGWAHSNGQSPDGYLQAEAANVLALPVGVVVAESSLAEEALTHRLC
jgi:hypothetical protein